MLTEPLTDAEIAELRKLDHEADPIPWQGMGGWIRVDAPDSNADVDNFEAHPENEALVVAARNALPRLLDELVERRARDPDHLAVMDIAHTDATVMRAWAGRVRAVLGELPPVARGDQVTIPRELYDRLRALLG